jgi:hypothetical protein
MFEVMQRWWQREEMKMEAKIKKKKTKKKAADGRTEQISEVN